MRAAQLSASPAGGHVLRSDLAQYCLPQSNRDDLRPLAWANALALLFVGIGVMGLRGPVFVIRELPQIEEAPPPVVILNQDEPPPPTQDIQLEEAPQDLPDVAVAPVVMAVLNPQAVSFAVPTVGPVQIVESGRYASPAPAAPMVYRPPTPTFTNIRFGGNEFRRQDFKPPDALFQRGMSGTVTLLIVVGEDGVPKEVTVEKGSGYPELDRYTVEQVKGWVAEVGPERRYRIAIMLVPRR